LATKEQKRRSRFWSQHYDRLAESSQPWLDYSNDRTQQQSLAISLEAMGSVLDRRCLDVGCGKGQLSLILWALGAEKVTAVDSSRRNIESARRKYPFIQWEHGDIQSFLEIAAMESFDAIFAVEVMQYLDFRAAMDLFMHRLRPGGRFVLLVPNGECPIVKKVIARYQGYYCCPSARDFKKWTSSRKDVARWHMRGLLFQKDQFWMPYQVTRWTKNPRWKKQPNRILFALEKSNS
jgi:SAM-dependent methyltransferase